jgi:hypothetical protein
MFPESFVEHWISKLTKVKDVVMDPFCGRGTSPFQALLMNSFDPDAYESERRTLPRFFHVAYQPTTLRQILHLRHALSFKDSDTDCMLAALTLGALHGESEKSGVYLSNQMPHTISTKPAYSVRFWTEKGFEAPRRDAFDLLRGRIEYRYASEPPKPRGIIVQSDMRDLAKLDFQPQPIRCVITSPPYFDVTSFEEDQWLRLWFLGGPPRPTRGRISRDDRIEDADSYWSMIADMWRSLGAILAEKSNVIIRIGATRISPTALVEKLEGTAAVAGRNVRLVSQAVSTIARRQTDAFRPGSKGCKVEVDCHFLLA